MSYSSLGRKESDMTGQLELDFCYTGRTKEFQETDHKA